MLTAIAEMKKTKWRSPDDPQKIRRTIKSQMKSYLKRGIVIQIGNAGAFGNTEGIWALPEYADVPWDPRALVLPK